MPPPNPDQTPKQPWQDRIHETAARVEDELRSLATYINDEVVPDVRRIARRRCGMRLSNCTNWHSAWTTSAVPRLRHPRRQVRPSRNAVATSWRPAHGCDRGACVCLRSDRLPQTDNAGVSTATTGPGRRNAAEDLLPAPLRLHLPRGHLLRPLRALRMHSRANHQSSR